MDDFNEFDLAKIKALCDKYNVPFEQGLAIADRMLLKERNKRST